MQAEHFPRVRPTVVYMKVSGLVIGAIATDPRSEDTADKL